MTRAVLAFKTITETGDHYSNSSFDTFTTWSLNNYNSIVNLTIIMKLLKVTLSLL